MAEGPRIRGKVAKLVTDDELIINKGERDGVVPGMVFSVIDENAMSVMDPDTGEDLGGITRTKVTVEVTRVTERIALAKRRQGGVLGGVSGALLGMSGPTRPSPPVVENPKQWPEGVVVGDPVFGVAPKVESA